jgi:hypothetical protein
MVNLSGKNIFSSIMPKNLSGVPLTQKQLPLLLLFSHELLWLSKYMYTYTGIEHFTLFKFDKTFVRLSYNKGRPLPSV